MTEFPILLKIDDLHVEFKNLIQKKEILHGINIDLRQGETLALVGESGSGKSITANAAVQLLPKAASITKGQIYFNQTPIHHATEKEMNEIRGKEIGMVFQDPMTSLNPTMTIGSQITEIIIHHEKTTYSEAKNKAIKLIERVGMSDAALRFNTFPFELSGGMRQRVMIAIAIACNPKLLIADEPTTALDTTTQTQIIKLLKELIKSNQMSLLFITHDLKLAYNLCSRVMIMHEGKIVESGSIKTIFSNPKHPYTKSLLEHISFDCHAN